jgi:hypothetical protein
LWWLVLSFRLPCLFGDCTYPLDNSETCDIVLYMTKYVIKSGAVRCRVCDAMLRPKHHKKNCCAAAYRAYLKGVRS